MQNNILPKMGVNDSRRFPEPDHAQDERSCSIRSRRLFRPPRGVTLRDIRFETMALGVTVVRGILWPSGERFAASLWATSGRPGGDRILQVIYTDRGPFGTELDVYELAQEIEK